MLNILKSIKNEKVTKYIHTDVMYVDCRMRQ